MMTIFIRLAIAATVFLGAGYYLDWDEPLRLRLGLVPAILCGGALAVVTWLNRPTKQDLDEGINVVREFMLGLFIGLVWIGVTQTWLHIAMRHPDVVALLDSDRPRIEQMLNDYEKHRNWEGAATYLESQLSTLHSPPFAKWLIDQTLAAYVRAAIAAPERAKTFFQRAYDLAEEHGIPSEGYRLLLEHAQQQTKMTQTVADLQNQLAHAETAANKRESGLIAEANKRLQAARARQLGCVTASLQHAMTPDFPAIRKFATTEIATAEAWKLPADGPKRKLAEFDAFVGERSPRAFPSDFQVSLRRVAPTDTPRSLVVDLLISGTDLAALHPLRAEDLTVSQQGRKLERIMPVLYDDRRRLSVAVLFDSSLSMQGTPLIEARRALQEFLTQLPAGVPYWIAKFSDSTTTLVDWSTDQRLALAASDQIQAAGHTALFQGITVATAALQQRSGDELVLVIFSDGANTIPGPSPEELVVAARRGGVRIHSIALQSGNVDEQVLQRLATETGGKSTVVTQTGELGNEFRKLADELRTPCLRIVALDYDATAPCKVTFGAHPAQSIEIAPQVSHQASRHE